jgi:SAM-dependent methyltransferase
MISAYDAIAEMYDRNWKDWYLPEALPALEKLFFRAVPKGRRVLDVCCGSGHVTAELIRRGYQVAGVDSSEQLIRLAKAKLPRGQFAVEDVRELGVRRIFDAAISTFDALNHLLTLDDLRASLKAVYQVLLPGGLFVFDLNGEDAYRLDMSRWQTTVDGDAVSLMRGTYDPITKVGATELIWFDRRNGDLWGRQSSTVEERCYENEEVLEALKAAGFRRSEVMTANSLGVTGEIALGRFFFSASV